jgi:hypothetical protein
MQWYMVPTPWLGRLWQDLGGAAAPATHLASEGTADSSHNQHHVSLCLPVLACPLTSHPLPLPLPLLQIIAINLPKEEIEGLKAMFHSIDTDKRWGPAAVQHALHVSPCHWLPDPCPHVSAQAHDAPQAWCRPVSHCSAQRSLRITIYACGGTCPSQLWPAWCTAPAD